LLFFIFEILLILPLLPLFETRLLRTWVRNNVEEHVDLEREAGLEDLFSSWQGIFCSR
jgi:hypothetical protein